MANPAGSPAASASTPIRSYGVSSSDTSNPQQPTQIASAAAGAAAASPRLMK